MKNPVNTNRRRLLLGMLSLPLAETAWASVLTPRGSEGPFYPTTAMRFDDVDNNLVKIKGVVTAAGGEIVRLQGRVLDQQGRPVESARVEIWQCDVNGRYLHRGDSGGQPRDSGFQGFGVDLTNALGEYSFRTIKPGPYPGRTPHIHLKVIVGGRERLTSQLYLPDHSLNKRDWLFQNIPSARRELVTMNFNREPEPIARIDLHIG
ncbi:MAG: protocatechuate 3,4-dioxygenase beta subunit [Planctomycetota bacterium]|jgi:protocatechuate 3,4-dioxygenase beta subunit